jgi:hypothetical protein
MEVILKLNMRFDVHMGVSIEEKTPRKVRICHFCTDFANLKASWNPDSTILKISSF